MLLRRHLEGGKQLMGVPCGDIHSVNGVIVKSKVVVRGRTAFEGYHHMGPPLFAPHPNQQTTKTIGISKARRHRWTTTPAAGDPRLPEDGRTALPRGVSPAVLLAWSWIKNEESHRETEHSRHRIHQVET